MHEKGASKHTRRLEIVPPVLGAKIPLLGQQPAGDGREEERRGGRLLSDHRRADQREVLLANLGHVVRVVRLVDLQQPGEHVRARLLDVRHHGPDCVGVARDGDALGRVVARDGDRLLLPDQELLGLVPAEPEGRHGALALLQRRHGAAVVRRQDRLARTQRARRVGGRDLAARVADDGARHDAEGPQRVDQRDLHGGAQRLRQLGRRQTALLGRPVELLLDRVGHAVQVAVERPDAGPEGLVGLQQLPAHLRPLGALAREHHHDVGRLRRLEVRRRRDALDHAVVGDGERPVGQVLSPDRERVREVGHKVRILLDPFLVVVDHASERLARVGRVEQQLRRVGRRAARRRRGVVRGGRLQDDMGVRAAHAERVEADALEPAFGPGRRLQGHRQLRLLERDVGVRRLEADVGRDDAVLEGLDHLDQRHEAGRAFGVAEVGLDGSDVDALLPEHAGHGPRLDGVAGRRPRAVAFDHGRLREVVDAGELVRPPHEGLLRIRARLRQPRRLAVDVVRRRPDDGPHRVPVADRVGQGLHEDGGCGLAAGVAVGLCREGVARAVLGQDALLGHGGRHAGAQDQVDAANESSFAVAPGDGRAGLVEAHQSGGAPGANRHAERPCQLLLRGREKEKKKHPHTSDP